MERWNKRLAIWGIVITAIVVVTFHLFGLGWREEILVTTATPPKDRMVPEREAMFYERLEGNLVRCRLCFRTCVIPDGGRGFCRNRENRGGTLYNVVYSRPSAFMIDPVEKEPQFHFLPGSQILCLGTAGCNFRCKFCHNWHLSQRSIEEIGYYRLLTPEEVVEFAKLWEIPTISFTYNEPTSQYEYMYDIARLARREGLRVIFHTNGAMNPEPLEALLPYIDAVTVDLKGFTEEYYQKLSEARLEPVLRNLCLIREKGVWLEIVNLVVPTLNDDLSTIKAMCQWIRDNLGEDTPVHFIRFFPAYRLTNLPPTPIETLEKAHRVAQEVGLRYVYVGNVPGHPHNSTYCPQCHEEIIGRHHFTVYEVHLEEGKCRFCGFPIPGIWK